MNKIETAGIIGIIGLTITAYLTTPKPVVKGYDHNKEITTIIKQQGIDTNNNGQCDLGDQILFGYDRNNDGNIDMLTLHWIRGMTTEGKIDYWQQPHTMRTDNDYDGIMDWEYKGFNKQGIPSINKKLLQPVKEQYARKE